MRALNDEEYEVEGATMGVFEAEEEEEEEDISIGLLMLLV